MNTFWDLGVDDETAIWFHQQAGLEHRFVDYYENSGEGLNHYVRVLRDKASARGFVYGAHFLPHDVRVTSLSTGRTRLDTLKGLGVTPARVVPRTGDVADDIQAARNAIAACWFDETPLRQGPEGAGGLSQGVGRQARDVQEPSPARLGEPRGGRLPLLRGGVSRDRRRRESPPRRRRRRRDGDDGQPVELTRFPPALPSATIDVILIRRGNVMIGVVADRAGAGASAPGPRGLLTPAAAGKSRGGTTCVHPAAA